MTLLETINLKKNYHTKKNEIPAVDDFSFKLEKSDFVAIVGPSGCGKSTILQMLCNLDTPSSGQIIKKKNIKIGLMPQNDCLFEWRSVLNNCLLGLEVSKKLNKKSKEYVLSLLNTYGLKDFINVTPNNLSGGMRQRVL